MIFVKELHILGKIHDEGRLDSSIITLLLYHVMPAKNPVCVHINNESRMTTTIEK
jgi:hypothetical protein